MCYAAYQFAINFIDYLASMDMWGREKYFPWKFTFLSMLSCSTHEMGQGTMGSLMYVNGLVLSGLLMITYALVWLIVFVVNKRATSTHIAKFIICILNEHLSCKWRKQPKAGPIPDIHHRPEFVRRVHQKRHWFLVSICARECIFPHRLQHRFLLSHDCRLQCECASFVCGQVIEAE